MESKVRHKITEKTAPFYTGIYSYHVYPRKQKNWRFIYLASIKIKEELSASVAERSVLISH